MHISEQVSATLVSDGWQQKHHTFKKLIPNFAAAGSLSNGDRVVTLTMSASGRWLERRDGWGKVERDVDLRNYSDPKEAIKAVLK